MNTKKSSLITLALSLLCVPAYANHGVEAIGAVIGLFFIIAVLALGLTIISWVVASNARKRRSSGLRLLSVFLSLPMLGVGLLLFGFLPAMGFICLSIFLISLWLIYRSMNYPDAENI